MAVIVVAVAVLAVAHWFYESVVATSLRLTVKFDLFAVRDEARRLARESTSARERDGAEVLCRMVDRTMYGLHFITVTLLWKALARGKRDPVFRKDVEEDLHLIVGLDSERFTNLMLRTIGLIVRVAVINSAMGLLYWVWTFPFLALWAVSKPSTVKKRAVHMAAENYAFSEQTMSPRGHEIRSAVRTPRMRLASTA